MPTDYATKNARRRAAKAADRDAYAAGRSERSAHARGGAFGKVKSDAKHARLTQGTSGLERAIA